MGWHDRMNRAIEYIENNLTEKIDMDNVAKFIYHSVSGFQRTFSIVTDMSVSEYVRKRRLSLAAFELQNSEAKIIDIALKYGYDSPDAFARAFKEIYGLSPSAARDRCVELKPFPRITFYMSIKGDVAMEAYDENSGIQITNMYYERMPAFRLIGKRYTSVDLDAEMTLNGRFNEWFQNGWFNFLFGLGSLPGHEYTALVAYENKGTMAWWIGAFLPENTPVPEGFSCVDFPSGIVGMCWIRGYRHSGEIFSNVSFDKCKKKLIDAGNTFKTDFNSEKCQWSFQRYDNTRFFIPDSDGKVIMDYGVYLEESDVINQAILEREKAELFAFDETVPESEDETKVQSSVPKPEVKIEGMAPYITDAQNNMLFCALTSLMLKLDNINESTPYYCHRINSMCSRCGDCGDKASLHKHHSGFYHFLVTVTGVALMVADYNQNSKYDLKTIHGILPPLLEDRLDFAMKVKGFEYTCPGKNVGECEIFRQIKESIRQSKPVLMKFGSGPVWGVITGFNETAGTVYGLDMRGHFKNDKGAFAEGNLTYTQDGLFALANWYRYMEKVVIVTGRSGRLGFSDYIERIISQLETPDDSAIAVIPRMLDSLTFENAYGVADFLLRTGQNMMEERWHACECFSSTMQRETDDAAIQDVLRQCAGHCMGIHDIVWQLWGHLGVGPHTDGKLPNLIGQMMMETARQETLKELFKNIRENDQAVLHLLKTLR